MMAVTLEDGDFLYALVRVTKPNLVVESGSGNGISGTFIATALQDNGHGRLVTYEPNPTFAYEAQQALAGLPAEVREGDSRQHATNEPDLVYIDSQAGIREPEMEHWLTCGYAGLVVVHDAGRFYDPLADHGTGVYLPGADGLWVGRAK